ncbi:MAG: cytochrome ubiquinol oxidase subunit I [Bacteroidales bacterium]|jgi:cytochrome d ubiquinol oxidase subunit I|nr:cytochrome ubiquinol oxidase subunit I [Bacteroidales bacterium]MCI2121132.1 cytochrome ubiquinol oxidase subunit I [Bacteroidales bacterium]MCI2144722.1 cytochrome ubiquinol oxidase subunit I [Bacteroidales bacterium]
MFQNLTDASRFQFALTALYHFLFVPLTLGLGFMIAIMESKYVASKNEFWKHTAKFWSRIFAINFACGAATGIILEFEFGTNWSNFSWFVGDIFGAPLAIEGILAFFLESTFFAVMFFGWNKVGEKFHLASTWLTALGAILSAVWILTANAWMQYPVGMEFNPATARNEMVSFSKLVFSPVSLMKIAHTVTGGFVLSSVVVIGISGWYLMKKRNIAFATKSIRIAAIFGIVSSLLALGSGDRSAVQAAKYQPMKLAAMEGLYDGGFGEPMEAVGIVKSNDNGKYISGIGIPRMLSILSFHDPNAYVPGINDIIKGGYLYTDATGNTKKALSFQEKKIKGAIAQRALADYHIASESGNRAAMDSTASILKVNYSYFGYGYLDSPQESVPDVPMNFYSFRIMVYCFALFFLLFISAMIFKWRKWLSIVGIICIPLAYITVECGWIVSEVGRQPWVVQDLLPAKAAVTSASLANVNTAIIIFAVIFTTILAAMLSIMFRSIKQGPEIIK